MDRPLCELYGYNEYSTLPTVYSPHGNVRDNAYIISALPRRSGLLNRIGSITM